jgi:hypothetical protein
MRQRRQKLVLCAVGGFGFAPCRGFAKQKQLAFLFRLHSVSQIPDEPREHRRVGVGHSRYRNFNRELMAVGVMPHGFHAAINERARPGRQIPRETLPVLLTQSSGNEQLGEFPTEHFVGRVPEYSDRSRIEVGNCAPMVHSDHGVQCRLQDGGRASLRSGDRTFFSLAADELSHLLPEG